MCSCAHVLRLAVSCIVHARWRPVAVQADFEVLVRPLFFVIDLNCDLILNDFNKVYICVSVCGSLRCLPIVAGSA